MTHTEETLLSIPLFKGIDPKTAHYILNVIDGKCTSYKKGDIILLPGVSPAPMCVVLSGSVRIFRDDFEGERSIFSQLQKGNMFGNIISGGFNQPLPITAVAYSDCQVYSFPAEKILGDCSFDCCIHKQIIHNFMELLAQENYRLQRKIYCLSCRTTREKLLAYLLFYAEEAGSNEIEIPFNRQELADYLCVDRSAMSNELSKMQQEGILTFRKNRFTVLSGMKAKGHHLY